jgi:cytochrome c556
MRIAPFALAFCIALLGGCGGSETSQGNNAQANISDTREGNQAAASNLQARVSAGDAAKIMHERHEGMETIGKNNKVLVRQLNGGSPDLATIRAAAASIAKLSKEASGWFPEGTGPEAGKTGAKPDIWKPENKTDFAAKLHDFQIAAPALANSTAGTDVNAMKARFKTMAGTCKACHDKYRSEMHHAK